MLFKHKTSTAEASPLKPLVSTLLGFPVPFNAACLFTDSFLLTGLTTYFFPTGTDYLPIL